MLQVAIVNLTYGHKLVAQAKTISDACEKMRADAALITGHKYKAYTCFLPTPEEVTMLQNHQVNDIQITLESQ